LKRLLCLLSLGLSACGAHAGAFRMAPVAPVALSPSAAPVFYLLPLQDHRRQREIWRGRSRYEDVTVEAEGLSLSAKAWQGRDYGSLPLLWHRQAGQALAEQSDYPVAVAADPAADQAAALSAAAQAGAKYLLRGDIVTGQMDKRGADMFFHTNVSGTNYIFQMKLQLKAVDVATGKQALDKPWSFERTFYDPTMLGSADYNTFPPFFALGLQDAAQHLPGSTDLRQLAGLPALTATPTATPTPMTTPPTPGPSPTAGAKATPTPLPTPDGQPYWVNPKTGKKVDPKWNFDPEDGTPRKDFVLRQPEAHPTPTRQLAPR
jgi:hypothetical protein